MKVDLIDHMGSDLTVVNAARVSFDKESEWIVDLSFKPNESFNRKVLSEKDQKLIKYLATHGHWTPFSHVMITMRETVPIFVARQRFKHMVGFTYNEVSRRYVDEKPEFFTPTQWRKAAENKKQGSLDEPIEEVKIALRLQASPQVAYQDYIGYEEICKLCELWYTSNVENGMAPEQARMMLPQSMYTSYYVTGSLAAWARAYKLRNDPHAQKEIQDLAAMWNDRIRSIKELTHSWKALTENG